MLQHILLNGGSFERLSSSRFVLSWWHIPDGWDYARARVVEAFFDDKKDAEKAVKDFGGYYPPEMPFIYPLSGDWLCKAE